MDEQKQQLIDRIHQAQNILVAVNANPSVDQLAAAIGLTLILNKVDKHGTAVFSGQVPSTLEFLKPEDTLEKTTDSLRDFIIALDKTKADKLRYKVEDDVVRIFITPYRTSITERDLNFSQGDFNVDVVVTLGVNEQADLDSAITAHGRILHDATIVSLGTKGQSTIGTINWVDEQASSLSEMVVALGDGLGKNIFDQQIATALLTGIVAATDRFSNALTSPRTMSASSVLMAAGANQQLIATELQRPTASGDPSVPTDTADTGNAGNTDTKTDGDGTIEINHEAEEEGAAKSDTPEPEDKNEVQVDAEGHLLPADEPLPKISNVHGGGSYDTPPQDPQQPDEESSRRLGESNLNSSTRPEKPDVSTEELTLPPVSNQGSMPLLTHNESVAADGADAAKKNILESYSNPFASPAPSPQVYTPAPTPAPFTPPASTFPPSPATTGELPDLSKPPAASNFAFDADDTLTDIERSVGSPHAQEPAQGVDEARSAVEAALADSQPAAPEPISALNAQPLGQDLHAPQTPTLVPISNTAFSEPTPGNSPADEALDMPLPANPFGAGQPATPTFSAPSAPSQPSAPSSFPGSVPNQPMTQPGTPQAPPPPVPPPMLPPLQ